jgi:hypothetical protein
MSSGAGWHIGGALEDRPDCTWLLVAVMARPSVRMKERLQPIFVVRLRTLAIKTSAPSNIFTL